MQRRKFIRTAGVGAAGVAAATTIAAPAIAQSMPEVKWRLTSSFPKSLDTLYGGSELFCKIIAEMSDNKFQVRPFAAGEIVPGLQVADAVQNGTVEAGQTAAYYYFGKHPNFVFETGLPFSMNQRQYYAWLEFGGGHELINDFYKEYNFRSFTFGGTGCQMGGWFRNELRSTADLRGLRFRVSGLAGKVLTRLGVIPTGASRAQIAGAFESGALDAAGWVSPVDDEKLALTRIAPWYYYPGWWQGSMAIHLAFNLEKWSALPKSYQAVVRAAAELANADVLARYDALNPVAVRRLVDAGAKLRAFPQDILEACWQATIAEFREASAADPKFQRVHDAYMRFRNEQYVWWQVAEYPYDNFIIRQRAKG